MSSLVFQNPQFAPLYLSQFAAEARQGSILVPVLPDPEATLTLSLPLNEAIQEHGQDYLDQVRTFSSMLHGASRVGGWHVIGGSTDQLVSFYSQGMEGSKKIRLSSDRLHHRLQVEIEIRSSRLDKVMRQEVISQGEDLVCLPPVYSVRWEPQAIRGIREFLGLDPFTSLNEVGQALLRRMGSRKKPVHLPDPVPTQAVQNAEDIDRIGYFGYRTPIGNRKVTVEGELEVADLVNEAFDESLVLLIAPEHPKAGALTEKMIEIWEMPL